MPSDTPLRKLGPNGPKVPALGLGLMGLSNYYGNLPSDEERFRLLDRAHELGCTFWDSADQYGDSEEFIGQWFKKTGKRNDIFLATKYGFLVENNLPVGLDTSAAYVRKACEKSLGRLGIETIDLFYAHRVNPGTPIEETMRELVKLKEEGKIRHFGFCEISSANLRRAHAIHPVAAVQIEYSPFVLDAEGPKGDNILATCRELGVAVVASSPLTRGLATATLSSRTQFEHGTGFDLRYSEVPLFSEGNFPANAKIAQQFGEYAAKKGVTPAQLALAWLLAQGDNVVAIPGTKKVKYLEENWGALNVKLSKEEVAEIRTFLESHRLDGARGPDDWLVVSYVDTKADE